MFVVLYLARLQFQLQIDKSEELENLQDVEGRLCTLNVLQVKFQLPWYDWDIHKQKEKTNKNFTNSMFQTEQHFDQKHSVKRERGVRDEQQVIVDKYPVMKKL